MIRSIDNVGAVAIAVTTLILAAGSWPQGQGRQDRQPPMAGAMRGPDAAKALHGRKARPEVEPTVVDPDSLVAVMDADQSAWVTPDGLMFFADEIQHEAAEPADGASIAATPGQSPTPSGYAANGMPIHHSLPGATFKLYLDFDGEFLVSRSWGIFKNLPGYSVDFDGTAFNETEQAVISRIWGRVAEDFAPFAIDVTTERPAELQRGHPGEGNVLWNIFTRNSSAGFSNGVAGVSLFTLGYVQFGTDTPVFTFWNAAPLDHSFLADVATQESGHMFGLLHDGTRFQEYYGGHGSGATSWGPVMGGPFGRNVTQWSLGDYPGGATRPYFGLGDPFQDDIAIISGKLGLRGDDVGDEPAAAEALSLGARHFITNPLDVDVFALPDTRGVELTITGFRAGNTTDGGNLDVAAEIVDANGLVVAADDDQEQTIAALTTSLAAGPHFLRVRSSSNPANYTTYGSLGEYTVSGRFANVAPSFTSGGLVSAIPTIPYDSPWATNVSAGPAAESSQQLTFALSGLSNPGLFSVPPALDPSGRLRFEPAGTTGTSAVTVVLRDDGGTDIGGLDTSAPVSLRIEVRLQFSGFSSPLPAEVLKAGRTVPVKFSLITPQPLAIAAMVELWASAADAAAASPASAVLASQSCNYDAEARTYHCNLKLPKTLTAGQTYWIAAKYLDTDGWVRPVGGASARTPNPLAFVAR